MQAAGWATKLEEWTFLNAAGDQVQGGQGAVAAVDPWYTAIVMPRGESEGICKSPFYLFKRIGVDVSFALVKSPGSQVHNSYRVQLTLSSNGQSRATLA